MRPAAKQRKRQQRAPSPDERSAASEGHNSESSGDTGELNLPSGEESDNSRSSQEEVLPVSSRMASRVRLAAQSQGASVPQVRRKPRKRAGAESPPPAAPPEQEPPPRTSRQARQKADTGRPAKTQAATGAKQHSRSQSVQKPRKKAATGAATNKAAVTEETTAVKTLRRGRGRGTTSLAKSKA